MGWVLTLVILLAGMFVSWLISCGLIWLITLCFSLEFSWAVATGIWLIGFLVKGLFSRTDNK